MTDFIIPCDTIARLSKIIRSLPSDATDWFRTLRIDNGVAVATNRRVIVMENVGGVRGIIHLKLSPELLDQCVKEAAYKGTLTVTVNEMLKFATAKTTFGYIPPGNVCHWSDEVNDFDKWRSIVDQCRTPAAKPNLGMFWDMSVMIDLAETSPSGRLVFEEIIDCQRPTIIRDITDYDWCAIFMPYTMNDHYNPASLPTWA